MCDQEYVDAGDLGCIETFINNVVASGARIEFNSFQASLAAEESSGNWIKNCHVLGIHNRLRVRVVIKPIIRKYFQCVTVKNISSVTYKILFVGGEWMEGGGCLVHLFDDNFPQKFN